MSDGQMEWPVTVETLPDRRRQALKVAVADDEMVLIIGRTVIVLPPSSDDQLCEAIRKGREVQQQMGRGLT